jgi:hypothetical protein
VIVKTQKKLYCSQDVPTKNVFDMLLMRSLNKSLSKSLTKSLNKLVSFVVIYRGSSISLANFESCELGMVLVEAKRATFVYVPNGVICH